MDFISAVGLSVSRLNDLFRHEIYPLRTVQEKRHFISVAISSHLICRCIVYSRIGSFSAYWGRSSIMIGVD